MKKILFIITLLLAINMQSQTVTDIYKQYIKPTSNANELREGLKRLESSCGAIPQDKCNKAKATALYLLSDRYYQAAYTTYLVDQELAKPILIQAESIYKQAYSVMALEDFPDYNVQVMTEAKDMLELHLENNLN
ncbi:MULTISPECIES: hypothetical protein [Bizionia]|uniref:Uncharacterized protein n=1 Tax=Bizionia algoritergicola TaxID=291187 RepID=A0A5D0QJN1_9FLAO|nr:MULTISPECIES: hypothetical protein [Bizionia]OBX17736.1 hypothetical protein BAA08_15850 [Bizionia sp. APA-3]TYB69482.1 hypothetical protein ES675_16125 [Bizionia algoritergicola]